MSIAPGTRFGPYEVTAAIGAGGMDEVYRATDTNLKREVAIKVLSVSFVDDAVRLARFQREAELLASLNHYNIAGVYFEMLTAQPPFLGEDVTDTVASVLRSEPDWSLLPELPPIVGTFLKQCLKKDPGRRIHDIADVRLALEGAYEVPAVPATISQSARCALRRARPGRRDALRSLRRARWRGLCLYARSMAHEPVSTRERPIA